MQKRILIHGDSPLVEEYTALCAEKSFDVGRDESKEDYVDIALELTNLSPDKKKKNLLRLDASFPPHVPLLSSAVTISTTEQATWVKHPERLIGVGALPTLLQHSLLEFAPSHLTNEPTKSAAKVFAKSLGKEYAFVQDSIGLVLPRILCMLINEACFAMMEQVAEHTAIDTAMKLGTNYPHGPVEWGERIGAKHVHAVVAALHVHFGEDRYRCAPLLQKAALRNSFY